MQEADKAISEIIHKFANLILFVAILMEQFLIRTETFGQKALFILFVGAAFWVGIYFSKKAAGEQASST